MPNLYRTPSRAHSTELFPTFYFRCHLPEIRNVEASIPQQRVRMERVATEGAWLNGNNLEKEETNEAERGEKRKMKEKS